ncbi:hypothetical protein CUZ89_1587 [Enterococcus xinjiangensis]|nr:hypothetical protein [Enterococcus lactis]
MSNTRTVKTMATTPSVNASNLDFVTMIPPQMIQRFYFITYVIK